MIDASNNTDGGLVKWKGERYTPEEFNELAANYQLALSEIEKSWFNWRQKYFLYVANIVATRNIITSSSTMIRTCTRIRMDAIPAAKTQLAAWQQAEYTRQTAATAKTVNDGVDKLIAASIKGSTDAIAATMEASNQNLISDKTVVEISENIRKQFQIMLDADKKGKEMRDRSLKVIEKSEQDIVDSARNAQNIARMNLESVQSDAKLIEGSSSDILDI